MFQEIPVLSQGQRDPSLSVQVRLLIPQPELQNESPMTRSFNNSHKGDWISRKTGIWNCANL